MAATVFINEDRRLLYLSEIIFKKLFASLTFLYLGPVCTSANFTADSKLDTF